MRNVKSIQHVTKAIILFCIYVPLVGFVHAQTVLPDVPYRLSEGAVVSEIHCGTPVPEQHTLQHVRSFLSQARSLGMFDLERSTVAIPIAFHIVRYDDGTADVGNAQIQDQLDVLNSAFASSGFQFFIHDIARVDNTAWTTHTHNSVEEVEMKEALAINPASVLNFYVCDLGAGLGGYAEFPWDHAEDSALHGVVVAFDTLPGGALTRFNEGDIAVHEIGHYLGLFHTFQNGCTEPGDEVDDTPYESTPAIGCPTDRDSCSDQAGVDPIHNFMNYSYDSCRNEFTPGQIARAQEVVALYKPTLNEATDVSSPTTAKIWTHFSHGESGFEYQSTFDRMAGFWDSQKWLSGDFNGDGYEDLVNIYGHDGRATVWTHYSRGEDGFEYQSTFQRMAGFWDSQKWLSGDFNGDGYDDLVNLYNHDGRATVWTHYSLGESGFEYQSTFQRMAGFWDSQKWKVGDFNGDGYDDLVNLYNHDGRATVWTHYSLGESGFEYQSTFQRMAGFWDSQKWRVGDFNGDGYDDLVNIYGHDGRATVWTHYSLGEGGFEYQSTFRRMAGFWDSQKWKVGDFNGDRYDDLVNIYGHEGKATVWTHYSLGEGGFEYQSTFRRMAGFWDSQKWKVGDFNGDGNNDLVNIYSDASAN